MTLQELDTWLSTEAAKPQPFQYASWTDEEKADFHANFPPNTPFSDEQRAVLRKYWLRMPDQDGIDEANESLPPHMRLAPVLTLGGDLVCNIDLLTDPDHWTGPQNMLRGRRVLQLDPATDFPQDETP